MVKKVLVFEEEAEALEFARKAEEYGLKPVVKHSLVILETSSDEELLGPLNETDKSTLKRLKILDGLEDTSCEALLKSLPKAKPVLDFLDGVIYANLGKIFVDTKIFFQPIASVKEKRVKAFEALCRPPIKIVDLIDVGKKSSEFSEQFCRERALSIATEVLRPDQLLFLNFHPRFLKDPLKNFGSFVSELLAHGLEPHRVVVELTEYEEVDLYAVKSLISFFKTEGIKVALDDVGSGYSGLFYLSELNPDLIKIDMELVKGVNEHKLKRTIVHYLIRVSHELGIEVVAEGVEREEDLRTLVYMGVDYVQGFLVGKPSERPNLEELDAWVRKLLSSV
ncbi:MAG: EAL domain-containing protein [Aquificae bacterium]|nr:EAL domain-containing protein [Aquificota bacterium]